MTLGFRIDLLMDYPLLFGRVQLLVFIGMVAAILISPLSVHGGGMDPNHRWAVNIGENWASVTEYKSYEGKAGDVFTRVQITGQLFGKRERLAGISSVALKRFG